ncbi:MAG TPA: hypothetical protein VL426_06590, partial [Candidatus Binatia bacterium]|nr:hypothetical protein [Candidatus Binatia bacterium]
MKKGASTAAKNYYELLQVSPRARPEVIHAAYRALLKAIGDDDADLIGRVSEAYGVLSSVASRARYDGEREAGGTIIGEYRVLEEIAEGGFGKTYKAEHVFLGEPVCIKQCSRISPDADAILIEEAKAMWHLRHFGIPAARTVMRHDDGSLMLVMSFIPGPTLA